MDKRERRGGCTVCGSCCLVLIIGGALAFLYLTPLGRSLRDTLAIYLTRKQDFKPEDCMANLKKLAQGLTQYLQSNDAYPPAPVWMDEMANVVPLGDNYTKDTRDRVFQCPAVAAEHKTSYGYAFNLKLSSKWADDVKNRATTPAIWDSLLMERNASEPFEKTKLPSPGRHNGVDNVLYCDGSVKSIRM